MQAFVVSETLQHTIIFNMTIKWGIWGQNLHAWVGGQCYSYCEVKKWIGN